MLEIRLHWLREPSLGVLQTRIECSDTASLADRIASAAALPVAEVLPVARQVMARIPEAIACGPVRGIIEVQLPFIGRKDWHRRLDAISSWRVLVDNEGGIRLHGEEVAICSDVRAALAVSGEGSPLTFSDTRTLSSFQASFGVAELLSGYGFSEERLEWVRSLRPAEPAIAALTLSLPGKCAEAWLSGPRERHRDFFEIYSQVARATQATLRRWLPYLYFTGADSYGAPDRAFPLIAYQAMRPYRGKPRYCWTYEVHNPESMDMAFRQARRDIEGISERLEAALMAHSRPDIARLYSAKRRERLLEAVHAHWRAVEGLLLADSELIDAMVALGLRGSQIGALERENPRMAAQEIGSASDEFVKRCDRALKRVYAGLDCRAIAPMLLIEATRALRPNFNVRASVRLTADGTTHAFSND